MSGRVTRSPTSLLLPNFSDALFQYVHGDIRFFFGHHQRRTETDRAWSAAEEEHALLEGLLNDQVALGSAVFLRGFVLYDVHADHQPAAAHIAHKLQLFRPL